MEDLIEILKTAIKITMDWLEEQKRVAEREKVAGVYMVNVIDENNRKTSSKIIIE